MKQANEALIDKSDIIEQEALALCLSKKDAVDYLLDRRFNPSVLQNYKREMKFILDHRLKYNKIPSKKTFQIEFPNVQLDKPSETIDYYYNSFMQIYEEAATINFLEKAEEALQKNKFSNVRGLATDFIDRFHEHTDTSRSQTTAEALDDFKKTYMDKTMGIPYTWSTVTRATRGLHPGNYVVFTGISKAGKTFTVMKTLTDAFNFHKTNVLCVSMEMSKFEMLTRHYACIMKLNYTEFTRRTMSDAQKKKMFSDLKKFYDKKKNWFRIETRATSKDFVGKYNMHWVEYLCIKHKPDVLWVDGFYLLPANNPQDAGGWKDLQANSQYMKNMLQERELPGVVTVQLGRGAMGKKKKDSKPNMKDIGGTVAYLQDADIIFGVNRPEELRLAGQNQLITIAARECQNVTVTMNWHFNEMNFDQTLGEIEGEETMEAGVSAKDDKEVDF